MAEKGDVRIGLCALGLAIERPGEQTSGEGRPRDGTYAE